MLTYEPRHEIYVFRTGPTQSELHKYRRWLEAVTFGFRKYREYIIRVAKIKALISFAVTAKLICAFVFAYADRWFSHVVAQIIKDLYRHTDEYLSLLSVYGNVDI